MLCLCDTPALMRVADGYGEELGKADRVPLAFVCSPAIARLLASETATLFREILHGARHPGAGVPA